MSSKVSERLHLKRQGGATEDFRCQLLAFKHMSVHTQRKRGNSLHVKDKGVKGERGSDFSELKKLGTGRAKGELRSTCQLQGYGVCREAGVLGREQRGVLPGLGGSAP